MLPRKIKIFGTPWHVAHQYELMKIPNTEWYQCINSVRKWDDKKTYRPRPENLFNVPFYEKGKYDLAVLHVDQQCCDESLGKSKLYRQLNEAITDIPKIVINHATPYWPEVFEEKKLKMKMRALIGDNHMVTNSHRAQEMWGDMGASTRTIIHGMDLDEWKNLPKEPFIFTTLSPAGLDRYYNRVLLKSVKAKLRDRGVPHIWIGDDWVARDFDDYKDIIGRGLLYFNPTLESPMPRSRTEAMLSGACVITLPNHGAETFIEHGKNGFLMPNNPVAIADLITELYYGGFYKTLVEMGQRGRETALKLFSGERFRSDWENLIRDVLRI